MLQRTAKIYGSASTIHIAIEALDESDEENRVRETLDFARPRRIRFEGQNEWLLGDGQTRWQEEPQVSGRAVGDEAIWRKPLGPNFKDEWLTYFMETEWGHIAPFLWDDHFLSSTYLRDWLDVDSEFRAIVMASETRDGVVYSRIKTFLKFRDSGETLLNVSIYGFEPGGKLAFWQTDTQDFNRTSRAKENRVTRQILGEPIADSVFQPKLPANTPILSR